MTPDEIAQAYDVLAQGVTDNVAEQAAKIGNSQAAIGGYAAEVARPSGTTSGLANYTYNRTLRPTVDTLTAELTSKGLAQALSADLTNKLSAAKAAYDDAQNAYQVAQANAYARGSNSSSSSSGNGIGEDEGTSNSYNELASPTTREEAYSDSLTDKSSFPYRSITLNGIRFILNDAYQILGADTGTMNLTKAAAQNAFNSIVGNNYSTLGEIDQKNLMTNTAAQFNTSIEDYDATKNRL